MEWIVTHRIVITQVDPDNRDLGFIAQLDSRSFPESLTESGDTPELAMAALLLALTKMLVNGEFGIEIE